MNSILDPTVFVSVIPVLLCGALIWRLPPGEAPAGALAYIAFQALFAAGLWLAEQHLDPHGRGYAVAYAALAIGPLASAAYLAGALFRAASPFDRTASLLWAIIVAALATVFVLAAAFLRDMSLNVAITAAMGIALVALGAMTLALLPDSGTPRLIAEVFAVFWLAEGAFHIPYASAVGGPKQPFWHQLAGWLPMAIAVVAFTFLGWQLWRGQRELSRQPSSYPAFFSPAPAPQPAERTSRT